jgi:hypothetical protein
MRIKQKVLGRTSILCQQTQLILPSAFEATAQFNIMKKAYAHANTHTHINDEPCQYLGHSFFSPFGVETA